MTLVDDSDEEGCQMFGYVPADQTLDDSKGLAAPCMAHLL